MRQPKFRHMKQLKKSTCGKSLWSTSARSILSFSLLQKKLFLRLGNFSRVFSKLSNGFLWRKQKKHNFKKTFFRQKRLNQLSKSCKLYKSTFRQTKERKRRKCFLNYISVKVLFFFKNILRKSGLKKKNVFLLFFF